MARAIKFIWINLFCLFVTATVFGQLAKTALTESEYGKWGTLRLGKISKNGKWIALNMVYENGQDTLFVRNTSNAAQIAFPKGIEPAFEGEYFACLTEGKVVVMNLRDTSVSYYTGMRYNFLDNKTIAISERLENNRYRVSIRALSQKTTVQISDIIEYAIHKNSVLYNRKVGDSCWIGIVENHTREPKNTIILRTKANVESLIWNKQGSAVSFLGSDWGDESISSIFHYDLFKKKRSTIKPQQYLKVKDSFSITTTGFYRHWISYDGNKIFFSTQRKNTTSPKSKAVEIWNSSDKWTHNLEAQIEGWQNVPKAAMWIVDKKKVSLIGDNSLPVSRVFGDGKYALLSNPQSYEPQYKEEAPRDYYLLDIDKQKKTVLFQQLAGAEEDIKTTQDGKYLIYFDNNSWYAYNVVKSTCRRLTTTGLSVWQSDPNDYNSEPRVYGVAGFSTDNSSVFLYDRFDLWEVGLTTTFAKRLTNGKEQGIRFRIAVSAGDPGKTDHGNMDRNKPIYLKATRESDAVSGYYTFKNNVLDKLVFDNNCIDELVYASGIEVYSANSSDIDHPIPI